MQGCAALALPGRLVTPEGFVTPDARARQTVLSLSVAFYLSLTLLARRIRRRWLRYLVTTLCVLVPLLVAYARLYRGMHHPTDVGIGNGLVCVALGWRYLRRAPVPASADTADEVAGLVGRAADERAAGGPTEPQTRPTRARTNE